MKQYNSVAKLTNRPTTQANPSMLSDEQILQKIRDKTKSRGVRGIQSIGRTFRIWDDDNSKTLSLDECLKAFKELRVGLTDEERYRAFTIFDRDLDGLVNYEEFLRTIRGEMNQFRVNLCLRAFDIMDKDKNGVIELSDVKQLYNAKKHPDVIAGKRTEDEILFEFLDTFDQAHIEGTNFKKDGKVTREEWIEYYQGVSMSIDDDRYFEVMMTNAWNLDGSRVTKRGTAFQF